MKLVKSVLLGSAAGFAAVAGAQAADLPMRKAAPVEYVRVCSTHGVGFFYIPGTDTCVRIGGRVRAEYLYREPQARNADATGFRARARIYMDARTGTDWGTLRTFIRMDFTRNTGAYNAPAGSAFLPGVNTTDTSVDRAFIQWAGITAGRINSFFDFYANDSNYGTLRGSDTVQNVLAYTATFGSGFSATIALEDANERRGAFTDLVPFGPVFGYGGSRLPDIVGNIRVDQGWGSAQLSGALHQIFTANANPAFGADTEYGYAVQGGVKFNLPMLAAGDVLWLQAAYAQGANSYLGFGGQSGVIGDIGTGLGVGLLTPDAVAIDNGFGGADIRKAKGWALTASFVHYWAPFLRQGIFGSYAQLDYGAGTRILNAEGTLIGGVTDLREWRVGSNLIWSPVSGFDIGVEVLYIRLDPSTRVIDLNNPARTVKADDTIEARLRFQRDF